MIPRRYVWLLRDETTLFEFNRYGMADRCKLCAALERPEVRVGPGKNQARHLAAHRAEKITADNPEAAVVAAATERT